MQANVSMSPSLRIALLLPLMLLAGCVGKGDGPTPILGTPAPPPPPVACDSINFEDDCGPFNFTNFAGGVASVVANPARAGLNMSDKVARMQKFAGEVFGGSTLTLPEAINFAQGQAFKVKVRASRSVPMLFKFEGLDKERTRTYNGGGNWQELCFSFVGDTAGNPVTGITIIFDLGVNGAATTDPNNWTFYFDEIEQVASCGGAAGPLFPVDFEAAPTSYDFGMNAGFGGGASSVIANPQSSGINTSAQVARMQKFAAEVFGGSTLNLGRDVDFTQGATFRMKVWATRAVPVLFKFEGLNQERSVNHPGGSTWQELCFDFTGSTTGPASNAITFIFDLGVNGAAATDPTNWTFYFDDIRQTTGGCGGGAGFAFPIDFEAAPTTYDFGMNAGFGGGASSVIANPQSSGINTSAQVARMQKFAGEVFGGSTLSLGRNIDFAPGATFKMKVWATRAVPVLFKFEGLNQERSVSHPGGGNWQELCFDFTGSTTGSASSAITFIFDLGVNGAAATDPTNWTFYFDDIRQTTGGCGGGGSGLGPVTFEPGELGQGFTWTVFENDNNPPVTFLANPDATGANTSATVARFTARQAGQPFAGTITTNLPTFTLNATNSCVKIKVWKSVISDVGIKFETASQASTGEIKVANTVTNQWQELSFNFASKIGEPSSTGIAGFILFPDFAARTQDNVIYFDDIRFLAGTECSGGGGGGGGTPTTVGFEGDPAQFDFGPTGGFGGGASSVIANPQSSGINTSAQVARMQKFAGEVFGGSTLAFPAGFNWTLGTTVKMKVWSPRVVPVLFKLEGLNQERSANHPGGSNWQELCYDFTGATSGPAVTGITVIFDLGVNGAAATDPTNWTFYYDDIQQTTGGCGGGGGGGGGGGLGPVTFEPGELGQAFAWTVFENGNNPPVTFLANPDATGANTSATVARFTARQAGQPFAGTITSDLPTFTLNATNSCVKIKVWKSVISDVGIKFETASQASTGEIKVANTVTNQWQELSFNFASKIGEPSSTGIAGFILFPDFAARTQDNVIYFDDIRFLAGTECSGGGGGGGGTPTTVGFEGDPAQFDFGPTGGFGGGASSVIANPQSSGINTSAQVARMQKFAGEVFGGSTLAFPAGFNWTLGTTVKMKVWSPRVVPVLFKLEGLNQERSANHPGGSNWQELCYDFTGATSGPAVTGITVIFDLGVNGAAATDPTNWTFYYDDIQQTTGGCGGGGGGGGLGPVTFEPGELGQGFTWTVFENGNNPPVTFLANPDATGANTSATVAQFTARQAGQPFAGTITSDLPTFTLNATNSCVKIKVWKSVISDVGIKFETASQASTGEIKVANTVTNQWQELSFNFASKIGEPSSTGIAGFILFPDFTARTQDNVIYFDDIRFLTGSQCP